MQEDIHHPTHTTHTTATPRVAPSRVHRVSWGAIWAGLLVTIVVQIMLTLLGAAIGAATINPLEEQNPTRGLGTGSAIWLLVTGLISVWIGACIAGRLSGGPRRADGMLHGIVAWSAATLAMLLMLATATGAVLGGAGALLSNTLQTPQGQNATASLSRKMQQAIPPGLSPTGRGAAGQPGQAGMPPATEQQAREVGERAAHNVGQGALWGFIALLLGLGVAAWGGWVGTSTLSRYNEPATVTT